MEDHTHDAEGRIVITPPEPIEPVDPTPAVEVAAGADVEVAKIQAERDIALAKLSNKQAEMWQESRVAEIEARMLGMQEALDRLAPPPPEPVVVTQEPEPEPEAAPAPEPVDQPAEEKPPKSTGFFGPAYR